MQARIDTRTPAPIARLLDRVRPYFEPRKETPPAPAIRLLKPTPAGPVIDGDVDEEQLVRLAELHQVPVELLRRQVELLRDVIRSIDGVPKSYRNIVDKADDVQRGALWILSGATTQAGFRRFFGPEGFMRPTKSVAWDFFNRVWKRVARQRLDSEK